MHEQVVAVVVAMRENPWDRAEPSRQIVKLAAKPRRIGYRGDRRHPELDELFELPSKQPFVVSDSKRDASAVGASRALAMDQQQLIDRCAVERCGRFARRVERRIEQWRAAEVFHQKHPLVARFGIKLRNRRADGFEETMAIQ